MYPHPHEIRLSLKRSRGRDRVLEYVVRRRTAYIAEIAEDLGMTEARVRAALHGSPPAYRVELSLVRMSLVERRQNAIGPYYVPTKLGEGTVALRPLRMAG